MSRAQGSVFPLVGDRIYLRPVEDSDVDGNYLRWLEDPVVTRHLEVRFRRLSRADLLEYVRAMQRSEENELLAIVDRATERHIGNIKLGPISFTHRSAEIGLLIGEVPYWGRGLATEAIRLVVRHAWDDLGLHKLTAGCYSTNLGSVRAFQRAGFWREGLRRSQFLDQDRYIDQILLGLVRDDQ